MAYYVATNTDTQFLLADGDWLYVPRDVAVINQGGLYTVRWSAAADNEQEVVIDGSVIAFGSNAVYLSQDSSGVGDTTLVIGSTGVVRTLTSQGYSAIVLLGSDNVLQNWGEVTGSYGAYLSDYNNGLVENHGVMSGADHTGVAFLNSDNITLVNSGTISGYSGIRLSLSDGVVMNSGSIIGTDALGYGIDGASASGALEVHNTGLIQAQGTAISLNTYGDNVQNSGEIVGDILLGGGNDTYDGRGGVVHGSVFGGLGDDTYIVDSADTLSESSGEGADTVLSTIGWTLGANFENLGLEGQSNIRGIGNALDNQLIGNAGNNRMQGGSGIDALAGAEGNDVLRGNKGDDTLLGQDGNDKLIGGMGADLLTGGDGEDLFVFRRIGHSFDTASGRDTISDFSVGEDRIDLRPLLRHDVFTFIDTAGFSGGNDGGEVRLTADGSGGTRVQVDVDGDGNSDLGIIVAGVPVGDLSADDFLL